MGETEFELEQDANITLQSEVESSETDESDSDLEECIVSSITVKNELLQ